MLALILPMVILAVILTVLGLFYLTLQRALSLVSADRRKMPPGLVWLNLIPVFGTVWMFVTVVRIAESLKLGYADRGIAERARDGGRTTGLVYALSHSFLVVLNVIAGPLKLGPAFNLLLIPLGFVGLVIWIIYWVRVAELANELRSAGSGPA